MVQPLIPPLRLAAALLVALSLVTPLQPLQAQDWGEVSDADRKQEIIGRYLSILESRPRTGHVLDRLLSEVGRGRALERLIEEYGQRSADEHVEQPQLPTLLGQLQIAAGHVEDGIASFDEALSRDPSYEFALRGKADALAGLELWDEAEAVYVSALEAASSVDDRQQILRRLADLSFAARRWDQASSYVEQLIASSPNDPYLRMELAQLYLEHDRWEEALDQYRAIERTAGTDMRQRAVAERDMAYVLARMGRFDEARDTYERARQRVSPDYWLAREIERALFELYGDENRQLDFIERYLRVWRPMNGRQWNLISEAYRTLGQPNEAIDALRRALRADSRNNETRLALIRALEAFQRAEHVEEIEQLYQAAVRQSAYDLSLRLQYIDFLEGESGRERAVRELRSAERVMSHSPDSLLTIADRYDRYGSPDDSERLYRLIASRNSREPRFQIAYGNLYFGQSKRSRAEEIWQGIVPLYESRASGLAALGDVYGNHGLIEEAVAAYEEAVDLQPGDLGLKQRLAELYERNRRNPDAAEVWVDIYSNTSDRSTLRTGRDSLIRLYRMLGFLERGTEIWSDKAGESSDGRWFLLLGKASLELGDFDAAEASLQAVLDVDPVSVDALRLLEETYRGSGRLADAVTVLEQIAEIDPAANRWVWDSLIEVSLRRFEDEQALAYAENAVADHPNDAAAHARLAALYRTLGNFDRAIAVYREAVNVNSRVASYQFSLAELLVVDGQTDEALDMYLRLVAEVADESDVLRAGRRAIALSLSQGRMSALSAVLEERMIRARDPSPMLKLELELYRQAGQMSQSSNDSSEAARFEGVLRRALTSEDAGVYSLAVRLAEQHLTPSLASALMRAAVEHTNERERILGLLTRMRVPAVSPALFESLPTLNGYARQTFAQIAVASGSLPPWSALSERVRRILISFSANDVYGSLLLYRLNPAIALQRTETALQAPDPMIRFTARIIRWKSIEGEADRWFGTIQLSAPAEVAAVIACVSASSTADVDFYERIVSAGMEAPDPVRAAALQAVLHSDVTDDADDSWQSMSVEQRVCETILGAHLSGRRSVEGDERLISLVGPAVRQRLAIAVREQDSGGIKALDFVRSLAQGSLAWSDFLRDLLVDEAGGAAHIP